MNCMAELEQNLPRLMKAKRFTLERLAKASGVPKSTLHGWINGSAPNLKQLKNVAAVLEVSLHELAFGVGDPFEPEKREILKELFSGDIRVTLHKIEKR
jgi:transcriptional regulator with XRE-family HTH domain